jgi:uracil-DNA glycosylase
VGNLFCSYLHASITPDGRAPTEDEYARLEPFFDAELRAIAAHVLLPVGERAYEYVRRNYTAIRAEEGTAAALHAQQRHGSGFLVVPIREPEEWSDADAEALRASLSDLLESDYRQISDLGRFGPGGEPYWVR